MADTESDTARTRDANSIRPSKKRRLEGNAESPAAHAASLRWEAAVQRLVIV